MRAAHTLLLLLALVVQLLWAVPSASWPGQSAPAPRCRCCACGGTGCCATQAPSDSPVSSPVAPLPSRSEGDHEVPFPPALPSSLLLAAPAMFHFVGYVQGIGIDQARRIFTGGEP